MVFNSFAAGKKVYGNGSYAPTRGRVSAQGAMGYLQREINKPNAPQKLFNGVSTFGRDGQSDTRSGVAAGMLANRGGMMKAGTGPVRNPGPTPPPSTEDGTTNQQGPSNPGPNSPEPNPQPGGTGSGNGGPVGAPPFSPPNPTIEIGADGILQLPYDAEWSQSVLDAMSSMNSQLMDLNFSSQEQAMEYGRANRDADIEYTGVKRGTLGANSQGGTAFSSQYGNAVGQNATAYGNYKNDLLMDNNLFKTRTDYERLAIQNAFNEMLRQDIINRGANGVDGIPNTPGGNSGNPGGGPNPLPGGGTGTGSGSDWQDYYPDGMHGPTPWDPKDHKGPKGPKPTPRDPKGPINHPDLPGTGGKGGKKKKKNNVQDNAKAYLQRKN